MVGEIVDELKIDKNIDMSDIMHGLGIEIGDIVCVYVKNQKQYLVCNEKYDLVKIPGNYDPGVPNLILGMVSDTYSYDVFSFKQGYRVQ